MKHTAATSAFYSLWRQASQQDLEAVRAGIASRNIDAIGAAMEANCMKFHATMFAANPPFTYMTSKSLQVIEFVQALRDEGLSAYFTMDAGPNVKILCRRSDQDQLHERLSAAFPEITLLMLYLATHLNCLMLLSGVNSMAKGKLYICGEYAVVDGGAAVIAAVNRHLRAIVSESDDAFMVCDVTQRPSIRTDDSDRYVKASFGLRHAI